MMRSALYYPHTEIRSRRLLKTSMLLWDKLHFIVPDANYVPSYSNKLMAEAIELIGVQRAPDVAEKRQTHEIVEEFATRKLPEPFYYRPTSDGSYEDYEMYPQKLLHETWNMLRRLQLTSDPRANSDYPLSRPTGLSIMSILADCCAGKTLARVTDQGLAYATLTNLQVDDMANEESDTYDTLVPMTLSLLDISDIPLENLIAFRKREEKETNGHTLTTLRHNYLKQVEDYAIDLPKFTKKKDKEERIRTFETDMRKDLKHLAEELWRSKVDVTFSKEAVVSVLAAVTMTAGALHGLPLEIPAAFTFAGLPITVGGGISATNRYAAARHATLQKHPIAYLYELDQLR